MLIKAHQIENKIENATFLELILNYKKENIYCTNHTFFRLNEQQRKLFKCINLKEYIINEVPLFVGIQFNKKYALFYRYKNKEIIRIIVDITPITIEIVTFYIIEEKQFPRF